jgi:uncharacterized lipoprotein YbaY
MKMPCLRWTLPSRLRLTMRALAIVLGIATMVQPLAVHAQDEPFRDQGGISSPLLSRCAGKFGAEVREADNAFPLLTLMGVPWMKIERTDRTVEGQHIVAVVTGIGTRNRRRGEVVGLRFHCLIDDKGVAVDFTHTELQPQRGEELPTGLVLRGQATYRPKAQLAPGAELRVQLFDAATQPPTLLTESVARSSWVNPLPFVLRLPTDMKLQGRKLVLDARLSLGATTLYRLKQPVALDSDRLMRTIEVTIDAVTPSAVH